MKTRYIIPLLVLPLFLASCGGGEGSTTSHSSSITESFSLRVSIEGEGDLSLYFDGTAVTEENFDDVVEPGDTITLIANPGSRYELESLTLNGNLLQGVNQIFTFVAEEGLNLIHAVFIPLQAEDVFDYTILNEEEVEVSLYHPSIRIPDPVIIPDEVTGEDGIKREVVSLGANVFQNTDVTSVLLGKNIREVDENAFTAAMSLSSILVDEENPYFVSEEGILYSTDNALIRMPIASSLREVTVKEGTTAIANHAFEDCSGLRNISFPNTLVSIGDSAFYDARGLRTPTFPSSLRLIGAYAFRNTESFQTVILPEGVEELGEGTFYASNLTSVHLPSTIQMLPHWAFYTASSLTSITFSEGLVEIGEEAFFMTGIRSLVTPSSLRRIGNSAFSRCSILTSLTLNEGLEAIGNSAFVASAAIEQVTIPSSVVEIGNNPFAGIVSIGYAADTLTVASGNAHFEARDNVLYSLAENRTLISYSYGKADTTYSVLDGTVEIGPDAFLFVGNVDTVVIPTSVTSINAAFASMYTELSAPKELHIIYEGTIAEWSEIDLHGSAGEWHSGTSLLNGQVTCSDGVIAVL